MPRPSTPNRLEGSPPTLNGRPLDDGSLVQLATPAGWLEGSFEPTIKSGSRHRLHVPLPGGGELEVLLPPEARLRWPPDEDETPEAGDDQDPLA